jgi:Bifunctional DNA primase/polymerase, N-terminal
MIDAALDLAAHGWEIFPCWWAGSRAKTPITKHGHLEATTDPDQIKLWWSKWPRAMIGAKVPDSLLVIDIDPRNGGDLAELESLTGPLPPTLTVWSGRNDGGRHLYYLRPFGPLTSTRLPEGIDLKVNGYCIVPPSLHPATGQPYRWDEQTVESVPHGLRELLRPLPPRRPASALPSSKSGKPLVDYVAKFVTNGVNNALFWAACKAAEDGILDQIEGELVSTAVSVGESEKRARNTVKSARRKITGEA